MRHSNEPTPFGRVFGGRGEFPVLDDGRGDDGESFYEILESWTTRKVDFKNSNSGKSSNKVQTPAGFSIKQDIIFCSTTRNVGEIAVDARKLVWRKYYIPVGSGKSCGLRVAHVNVYLRSLVPMNHSLYRVLAIV